MDCLGPNQVPGRHGRRARERTAGVHRTDAGQELRQAGHPSRRGLSLDSMAKKLSSLFFSTAKKMARLQRQAFKLASAPHVKRPKRKAANAVPPVAVPPLVVTTGAGLWQNLIHKVAPSRTELLGRLAYSLYRPVGGSMQGLPL